MRFHDALQRRSKCLANADGFNNGVGNGTAVADGHSERYGDENAFSNDASDPNGHGNPDRDGDSDGLCDARGQRDLEILWNNDPNEYADNYGRLDVVTCFDIGAERDRDEDAGACREPAVSFDCS